MTDPLVAELAYREAVAARERVRAIQRAITLPLRLVAAADLAGSIVVLIVGQFHLFAYFAPAYIAVLATSAWWYRRYATKNGLQLPVRPWVLILAATLIAATSTSQLGTVLEKQWVSDFGPPLALALGTGLTAYWLRSRRIAFTATAMVASAALVSLVTTGDRAVALQLTAFGVLLWHASLAAPEHKARI